MDQEPLDSLEYESTYLELRPLRERPSDATNAPILARRRADVEVDDAVASYGIAATDTCVEAPGPRTTATPPGSLSPRMTGRAPAAAVHRPAGLPAGLPRLSTGRRCSGVPSRLLTSPRRPRSWTQLGSSLLVVATASLGIASDLDMRAERGLFVALTGVLLLGWARLAWRGPPRTEPFGATATRVLDRLVTVLGDVLRHRALGEVRASGVRRIRKDRRARAVCGLAHHCPSRSVPQPVTPVCRRRLGIRPGDTSLVIPGEPACDVPACARRFGMSAASGRAAPDRP
jgi:hypothetical protein